MLRYAFMFPLCAVVALSSCKKPDGSVSTKEQGKRTHAGASAQQQTGPVKFDACAVITNQEVADVEASPVKDTKNSGRSDAGLSFAQCFYTTEEFNRSVSLAVTQPDPDAQPKRSIKEYWQNMFGKYEKEDKDRGRESDRRQSDADKEKSESLREQNRERGEEGESVPPKKIEGVGDEAFWLGNRVGGALYVLHKRAFVRVSVGGPDPEEKKIEKCKALAQKALARL